MPPIHSWQTISRRLWASRACRFTSAVLCSTPDAVVIGDSSLRKFLRGTAGGRPRVQVSRSVAEYPNQRWSTDIASVWCGESDGWCSFVPVLDCCTRQVLGWELALSARAKTAERALESALRQRFGWTRGAPAGMSIRHDNGLVFGSRLFRGIVKDYGLQ